jgi:hypothetical protein
VSVLHHRTTRFVLVVAALAVVWQAYLGLSSSRRIAADLAARLDAGSHHDVAVTLGFAPEDFHMRVFQAHGVVSGVKGTTVQLKRVTPTDVRAISRYYWVQSITRGSGS